LEELTDKFGGATSFVRSPGKGLWHSDGETESDTIAVIEVMAESNGNLTSYLAVTGRRTIRSPHSLRPAIRLGT